MSTSRPHTLLALVALVTVAVAVLSPCSADVLFAQELTASPPTDAGAAAATAVVTVEPSLGPTTDAATTVGAAASGAVASGAAADDDVVRGLLFWSTSCDHCHRVLTETLPPMLEHYGDRLEVRTVEITTARGNDLLLQLAENLGLADDRKGVPLMLVGDRNLLGLEIDEELPGIVDSGVSAGGLPLSPVFGLDAADVEAASVPVTETLAEIAAASTESSDVAATPSEDLPDEGTLDTAPAVEGTTEGESGVESGGPELAEMLAYSVFALLLIGLAYMAWALYHGYVHPAARLPRLPSPRFDWLVPVLAVVGIVVAGYLTYLEITRSSSFCPIGQCDQVQASPYARILGVPVALYGVLTYVAILLLWLASKYGRGRVVRWSLPLAFAIALWGTLFSTYLTSLELYVLEAVCMWCLMSAVAITLIMWLAARPGLAIVHAWRMEQSHVRAAAAGVPRQRGAPRPGKGTGAGKARRTAGLQVQGKGGKAKRKKAKR